MTGTAGTHKEHTMLVFSGTGLKCSFCNKEILASPETEAKRLQNIAVLGSDGPEEVRIILKGLGYEEGLIQYTDEDESLLKYVSH